MKVEGEKCGDTEECKDEVGKGRAGSYRSLASEITQERWAEFIEHK